MKTVRPFRRRVEPAPQRLNTDRGFTCPYCGDRFFYMKKHEKYCRGEVPHGTAKAAARRIEDPAEPTPILPVGLKDA